MQFFKRWQVHVVLFILGFFLLNMIIEFLFLRIDGDNMLMMTDMQQTENIDIVFVGNSYSRRFIDNTSVETILRLDTFNLSSLSIGIDGSYAMMQEMFDCHKPKVAVYVYDYVSEAVIVQNRLWPFLHNFPAKIEYTLEVSKNDKAYLDRFFPWRSFHPENKDDFYVNLSGKINPEGFYQMKLKAIQKTIQVYDRKGSCITYPKVDTKDLKNKMNRKVKAPEIVDVSMRNTLEKMKRLCDKNKCQLIVIMVPPIQQIVLGDQKYASYSKTTEEICNDNKIPFYHFAYAKEGLLPDLTDYFYNSTHINGDGAKIFSVSLARLLKEYLAGKDVSAYFYTPEAYLETKDYILNGWYTEKKEGSQITYTADSIYGSSVKPEYCFTAVDEDGEEILLQDYYSVRQCTIPEDEMKDKTIRIKIRNAANRNQDPIIAVKK